MVDQDSAYFQLVPTELDPLAMYQALNELLRP
jgi:hypothetical protein